MATKPEGKSAASAALKLHSVIKPVPLAKMLVSNAAQRELRQGRVDYLLSQFDLEQLGNPVVNYRDGHYYVIDGQHRIAALKAFLGDGWEEQVLDCRCYSGLSEREEADMFDRLNNQLTVATFDRFKVRVTAGRAIESAVRKIVEKRGLKITRNQVPGAISAVGTLVRVYNRTDAETLSRVLRIAYEAFGDMGLAAAVIDGLGHMVARYSEAIDDDDMIRRLMQMPGGIGALMTHAELLRKQTGAQLARCVAASIVDALNNSRGGRKLPSWWKVDAERRAVVEDEEEAAPVPRKRRAAATALAV